MTTIFAYFNQVINSLSNGDSFQRKTNLFDGWSVFNHSIQTLSHDLIEFLLLEHGSEITLMYTISDVFGRDCKFDLSHAYFCSSLNWI